VTRAARPRTALVLALFAACGHKTPVADAHTTPTEDECRAAIANVRKVAPGRVGADSAELGDCMRMPRGVVTCLGNAASAAAVEACAGPNRFGHGGGEPAEPIGGEVSADECQAAAVNAKKLRPEVTESVAGLVDECVRSATRGDVKCLTAATTAAEAKRCGLFGLE